MPSWTSTEVVTGSYIAALILIVIMAVILYLIKFPHD